MTDPAKQLRALRRNALLLLVQMFTLGIVGGVFIGLYLRCKSLCP